MTGSVVRQWPITVTLLVLGSGLLTVWLHHFRAGGYLVAAALLGAAGLRAVLPPRAAGLLVVRGRALDVGVLASLGAAVLVLTFVVPVPE